MNKYCECGCGNVVKKKGSHFCVGHNMRNIKLTPQWKKNIGKANSKKIKIKCVQCGKEFLVAPYRIKNGARFCSNSCRCIASRGKSESVRISRGISSAVRRIAREGKFSKSWREFVEWDMEEFKSHMEKQFTDNMSWETYGITWQIDHIIPVSVFNITSITCNDFKRCWDLSNLQPLSPKENQKKRAKLYKPFQPSLF